MRYLSFLLVLGMVFLASAGVVAAAPGNFSGQWDTTWNGSKQATRLSVTQAGNRITGGYTYQNGRVTGVVDGNVVVGSWWQTDGARGEFKFVLSPDGESFKGKWKNASKQDWQGTWNGTRR